MPASTEAERLRDEALARILENAGFGWRFNVINEVSLLSGREMSGEEIRSHCEGLGLVPHHYNAWGSVIRLMVTSGKLIDIGSSLGTTPQSHARRVRVYRVA